MDAKCALLTAIAVLFSAHQVLGKKWSKKLIDAEEGPPCGYRIIKRLENCCAFPDFISTDIFAGCHEELKDTSPQEEGGMETEKAAAKTKSKKSKKYGKSRNTRASYKVGWGGGRSMGTYRGGRKSQGQSMCIYECVLRNQSLLNSEGDVDVTKMENAFIKDAPSVWKPIIKAAIGSCSSQYSKIKPNSLPKPITSLTGRSCRFGPSLYMSCFRNYLTVNCEKNSVLNIDNSCKEKVEFLKTCNNFKVRGSSGKGGKYWGAVDAEDSVSAAAAAAAVSGGVREAHVAAPAPASAAFKKGHPELKNLYNVFG